MHELSFAILAYNDALSLPKLTEETLAAISRLTSTFELIIMNDGSDDGTAAVAEALARSHPQIRVIHHPSNRGVGAAFNTAMAASRFDLVGYVDGDGQYVAEDLVKLFESLHDTDVASGQRVHRADSWLRSLASLAYRALLKNLFALSLRDTNSGFKLYRRWVIENAQPLESTGAFFDAEVLIKARAKGAKIVELPIRHLPRRHGRALGLSRRSVLGTIASCVSPSMKPYRSHRSTARALGRVLEWISEFDASRAS